MENLIYTLVMYIHMASGFLATFLFIPLNLFNRKGSRFHKAIGQICLYLILSIAISGLLMLANPLFPNKFAIISQQHHWNSFFTATYYEPAFFIWLDIITLYMFGSSIRIWYRIKLIRQLNKPAYNCLDISLACAITLSSLFFIIVGFIDLKSQHPFANVFIFLGVYLLIMAALDLWTFHPSSNNFMLNWGWAVHGYKMLFVWHGLITAYTVRLNVASPLDTRHPVISIGTRLITIIVFFFYWKSKQKTPQSN